MDRDALIALLREHFRLEVRVAPRYTFGLGGGTEVDVTVSLVADGETEPVLTDSASVSMSELVRD